MKYLLPSAVLILMLSIGMSLKFREIVANWRRLTWVSWIRLLLATFLVPPLIALSLGQLLPLSLVTTAGLFLIAVAPGAPLLTRNIAKRGFDMQMAASYQVWSALMIPIMIPLLVALAGKLYQRDIWIPPLTLLAIICKQQFLPLLAGMTLMHFAPAFCTRVQRAFNIFGNLVLTAVLIALLWKMGPALKETSPWLYVAVPALAVGCIAVSRMLLTYETPGVQTLVICNVNRHVGLALLLSGQYLRTNNHGALPAVACYALVAPLIMGLYAKFARRHDAAIIERMENVTTP
ncbi:MAG: bile acid:sodium symporter family protein [Bryobacteraceae bacterium]